jgi:hypothetical protein
MKIRRMNEDRVVLTLCFFFKKNKNSSFLRVKNVLCAFSFQHQRQKSQLRINLMQLLGVLCVLQLF